VPWCGPQADLMRTHMAVLEGSLASTYSELSSLEERMDLGDTELEHHEPKDEPPGAPNAAYTFTPRPRSTLNHRALVSIAL
jgi:hypothetical protein